MWETERKLQRVSHSLTGMAEEFNQILNNFQIPID
jgi:hypothetical protein